MPVYEGIADLCAWRVPYDRPFVILDLEYTSWEGAHARGWGGANEYREIIDIGAVRVDPARQAISEELQIFVKPMKNPVLSDYIMNLTGIRQSDIETRGTEYPDAHRRLFDFIGPADPVLFNGWDGSVIRENAELHGLEVTPGQFARLLNIRPLLSKLTAVAEENIVSSELAEDPGAQAHRALDDARKIFRFLFELRRRGG